MSKMSLAAKQWPLSNNFILLSVLLLCATVVGLTIATESVANRLATYAYCSLVVGVVLRVLELAVGRRIRSIIDRTGSAVAAATGIDTSVNVKSIIGYAGALTAVTGGGVLTYWIVDPNTNIKPSLVLLFLVVVSWMSVVHRVIDA